MITISYNEDKDVIVLVHDDSQNTYVKMDQLDTKQFTYIVDWLGGVRGVGGIAERFFFQLQQIEMDDMVKEANGGFDIGERLTSWDHPKPWDDDSNIQEYYDPENN